MEEFLNLIINSTDDEIEKIIIERASQLENSPSTDRKIIIPNETLYEYGSFYHGFIKNDVKIYSSMGSADDEYYTLGNYDYLISFFRYIKNNKINNMNELLKNMASFLNEYFGEFCGIDKRPEHIRNNGHTIDIFKSTGLAACVERSAVSNNILSMLGLNSYFVTGIVNGEEHAFNIIINSRNQFVLIDTTSCCGLYNSDNNLIGSATYCNNLGNINERLESFLLNGQPLSFYDTIARINTDGTIKYERNGKIKTYSVEPIILEETKSKSF